MSTLSEKLILIRDARDDIQEALNDKGQVVGKDIRDYATAIDNIDTSEDLDDELTAQEAKIAELTVALNNKTAGEPKPNIFVQESEPNKKDGIWLQTNKEYVKVIRDDNVFIGEKWDIEKMNTLQEVPDVSSSGHPIANIGNYIYSFCARYGTTTAYKYDVLNDTYTQLTNTPELYFSANSCIDCGTNIYLFKCDSSSTYCYKYDTLTDTYTKLASTISRI